MACASHGFQVKYNGYIIEKFRLFFLSFPSKVYEESDSCLRVENSDSRKILA